MTCKGCGAEFEPTRSWQVFCNSKCKMDYHNSKKVSMGDAFVGLSDEDRKTVLGFLDEAEKDPTMWVDLIKRMEEEQDDEVPVP